MEGEGVGYGDVFFVHLRGGNSTSSCEPYTSDVSASLLPSSCSVLQSIVSPHNRDS